MSSNKKSASQYFKRFNFYSYYNIWDLKKWKRLAKHEYFFKNEGKSSYMVYFARIPCIIDETDAKNTKKRD